VNRIKAVKKALDGRVKPVYLEIGVSKGYAFRCITADEKIAVDPVFKLSARSRKLSDAKARATHYFETTSDDFFANQAAFLEERGIDVALIDGLHTYEQTLRDVENTLRYLREGGVMIVHDCNPARAPIGAPAKSYDDFRSQKHKGNLVRLERGGALYFQPWSGDVWKVIVNLRSTRDDLRVAVLNCDCGIGLIRKGVPESRLPYSVAEIDALDYADLAADRERLLNLKPPGYLDEFLASERPISPKS
jgi:hypothetical protein